MGINDRNRGKGKSGEMKRKLHVLTVHLSSHVLKPIKKHDIN